MHSYFQYGFCAHKSSLYYKNYNEILLCLGLIVHIITSHIWNMAIIIITYKPEKTPSIKRQSKLTNLTTKPNNEKI